MAGRFSNCSLCGHTPRSVSSSIPFSCSRCSFSRVLRDRRNRRAPIAIPAAHCKAAERDLQRRIVGKSCSAEKGNQTAFPPFTQLSGLWVVLGHFAAELRNPTARFFSRGHVAVSPCIVLTHFRRVRIGAGSKAVPLALGRTNYLLKTSQFKRICPTLACTTPPLLAAASLA
jgi:hypothetical protein